MNPPPPILYYIAGPSGGGKDSVIAWARERILFGVPVVFAHRYITRAADRGGENHVALSEHEFELRLARGLFAMHWQSHGNRYGIGIEIRYWLARGVSVVVSGSREYLARAREAFPELVYVHITAPPEILRERLRARGREDEAGVEARIERTAALVAQAGAHAAEIVNHGRIDEAGGELLALLLEGAEASAGARR